jgi:hypothetical protein
MREAESAFLDAVRMVLSCVSRDGLITGGSRGGPEAGRFVRPIAAPARLAGSTRLRLDFELHYRLREQPDGSWTIQVDAYIFTVYDSAGQRLFGYHWHPSGIGDDWVTFPHLHIYVDAGLGARPLGKLHFPAKLITLADVVHLLIRDLGIEPRRRDWRAKLQLYGELLRLV